MKNELRFVFDTNVIISALLLPDSKPRQAFNKALDRDRVLISIQTVYIPPLRGSIHHPTAFYKRPRPCEALSSFRLLTLFRRALRKPTLL